MTRRPMCCPQYRVPWTVGYLGVTQGCCVGARGHEEKTGQPLAWRTKQSSGSIRAISAVIEVSLDRSPVLFGAAPCAQGIMKHRHAIVAHLPRLPLM